MTYVLICDANAANEEVARRFREMAAVFRDYSGLMGIVDGGDVLPRRFYRGQSKMYQEDDAFYIQLDDRQFLTYLAGRTEFARRFRKPRDVRVFERV